MPIPAHVADRTRVDRASARASISLSGVTDATDAEIDAALASVNPDAIYDEERSVWTTQVWDRRTPINGVAPATILARGDMPTDGSDIYLLLRDGQIVMIQPHEPEAEGIVRIPRGQGLARGRNHADNIAAENTRGRIGRAVADHIKTSRGSA